MTLTNHLLTGSLIAKVLPLPLAIPLAFASHFVLDALPHFGFEDNFNGRQQRKKLQHSVWAIDVILSLLLSIWLIKSGHIEWFFVGLVAYSPDFIWIYRYTIKENFGKLPPAKGNRFIQFHSELQKYERVWGIFVELIYATIVSILLVKM